MCIIVIFYTPLPLPKFLRRDKKKKASAGQNRVSLQRVFKAEIKIARMVSRIIGKGREK
jgi:hypothetical protein